MQSWVFSCGLWKLLLQQAAQQVGHGHALREGRYLMRARMAGVMSRVRRAV